jgi:hypothetical protein
MNLGMFESCCKVQTIITDWLSFWNHLQYIKRRTGKINSIEQAGSFLGKVHVDVKITSWVSSLAGKKLDHLNKLVASFERSMLTSNHLLYMLAARLEKN